MENRPIQISVVIPAWHGRETIGDCLQSILNASRGRDLEIIVVESSGDEARELIALQFPTVHLVATPERMQVGAARNLGVDRATGELVFFVDQDCVVPADWFDRLVPLMQDPSVGAVGGSIGVRNPTNLSGLGVYLLEFFRHLPTLNEPMETSQFLLGCNLVVRRSLFAKVRFPDQTLGEDTLFCARIRSSGLRLVYAPAVTVAHWNRSGWREFFRYNRLMGIAAADYHRHQQTRVVRPFLRVPSLLLLTPPATWLLILGRLLHARSRLTWVFLILTPVCLSGNFWWALAFRHRLLEEHTRSKVRA